MNKSTTHYSKTSLVKYLMLIIENLFSHKFNLKKVLLQDGYKDYFV